MVMKVSKEGHDVQSTEDKNLSYSSELASHNIANILSVRLPAGYTSLSVKHGLNFVPKVWVYMIGADGDGTYYRRIPYLDDTTFKVDYYITDSSVVLETDGSNSSPLDFKVIVFTRSPTP